MEHRDLLKDQIEQFGRALGQVLADFLKLKSQGLINQAIEISNEKLKKELDIDLDQLIILKKPDLLEHLNNRGINAENFDILSIYFMEVGESLKTIDKTSAKKHLIKSVQLLELANETTRVLCFERTKRKTLLEKLISEI